MGIFDRKKDPPKQDEESPRPGQQASAGPGAVRNPSGSASATALWEELEDVLPEDSATVDLPEPLPDVPTADADLQVESWFETEQPVPTLVVEEVVVTAAPATLVSAAPPAEEPPMVREVPAPPQSAIFFFPAAPESLEETGLNGPFIQDHIVRILYFAQQATGSQIAEECALPFESVIRAELESLRREQFVDVKGQRGIGDGGYVYILTSKGSARALEALQKSQYRGPLPVPLDRYIASVKLQTLRNVVVTEESIKAAFSDLIIDPEILDQVGPAVNSGSSMFLFGYPGNGKTSIAERITNLLGDNVYIPAAIEVDGYVVKVFDSLVHETAGARVPGQDARWVRIKRPIVIVGGELIMASLDLLWNDIARFYEAPLQMKANLGMFLIDDFGRQMIRPQDLLNRWIVPLEKRIDYLTLVTGKKIQIPFDQLIVFSTNLDPNDLVDDAFLRRIKFKIDVKDPSAEHFTEIMKLMCRVRRVPYNQEGLDYMLAKWWAPYKRPLRMCQPRDILDQMIAIAKYKQVEPALSNPELIDRACATYFVSSNASSSKVAR